MRTSAPSACRRQHRGCSRACLVRVHQVDVAECVTLLKEDTACQASGSFSQVPGRLRSGAFITDVQLTARFGSAPTVSGHVDGFEGGAHVDAAWRVDLETIGLGEGTAGTGIADGGGDPGTWCSDPYAPDGAVRPTGINDAFHAHCGDGHAMGVYATRNADDDAADWQRLRGGPSRAAGPGKLPQGRR